ncbi:MAG TPA: hypothetical protein VHW96_17150 [Solirubrobacteraceae bacterium]|nr:hypothetical protein [Solirubrobacteraceae bacterium]
MLGSILTRQYRFATRGIAKTLETAQQAIDLAGGLAGGLAERLGLHNGHGESGVVSGEVVPEPEPVASPPPPPAPSAPPPPAASAPARAPEPPAPRAPEPPAVRAPEPPAARAPEPPAAPAPEPEPEPAHVSAEPELVEEFSEPGAEDGAGAQVRVGEPWPGYRRLKARDVIARLTTATREELAAVELFELAGANRKSVVVAAQRALKQASPPR